MALIYKATLIPTKLELLTDWLPKQDWFKGSAAAIQSVAAFRFDDPADAVGIETILVRVGEGPVYQVPLTYREAALEGADEWLLGTTEHSVLGTRWIYDAIGDPVYAAVLANAILGNTGQAEQFVSVEDRLEPREWNMSIASTAVEGANVPPVNSIEQISTGDGDPIEIITDTVTLSVNRCLDSGSELPGTVLTGTWPNQSTPVPLASAKLRD